MYIFQSSLFLATFLIFQKFYDFFPSLKKLNVFIFWELNPAIHYIFFAAPQVHRKKGCRCYRG